jgi:hypothetical protein
METWTFNCLHGPQDIDMPQQSKHSSPAEAHSASSPAKKRRRLRPKKNAKKLLRWMGIIPKSTPSTTLPLAAAKDPSFTTRTSSPLSEEEDLSLTARTGSPLPEEEDLSLTARISSAANLLNPLDPSKTGKRSHNPILGEIPIIKIPEEDAPIDWQAKLEQGLWPQLYQQVSIFYQSKANALGYQQQTRYLKNTPSLEPMLVLARRQKVLSTIGAFFSGALLWITYTYVKHHTISLLSLTLLANLLALFLINVRGSTGRFACEIKPKTYPWFRSLMHSKAPIVILQGLFAFTLMSIWQCISPAFKLTIMQHPLLSTLCLTAVICGRWFQKDTIYPDNVLNFENCDWLKIHSSDIFYGYVGLNELHVYFHDAFLAEKYDNIDPMPPIPSADGAELCIINFDKDFNR